MAPQPAEIIDESPLEELLSAYRSYLVRERGLTETTVYRYQRVARLFLAARSDSTAVDLKNLTAAEIAEFVLRECRRGSVAYASHVVTALRSLLLFLHLEGTFARPLVSAVPAVARWRGSALPRALDPSQVARLLKSCDRRRAVGRRDYAILMLLVRLGLRVGKVAALRLDDIDWRAGDIVIRGKGRRQERLPLPADVGETVAASLRHGRLRIDCRTLFLRARAPHGAMSAGAVRSVVRDACLLPDSDTDVTLRSARPDRCRCLLQGSDNLGERGRCSRRSKFPVAHAGPPNHSLHTSRDELEAPECSYTSAIDT